jgi:hypothetical protein
MRRWFFIAILAALIADASGVTSLALPEPCGFNVTDQAPDGGCPAFCSRCSCCAAPVVSQPPALPFVIAPSRFSPLAQNHILPVGSSLDILHVPKALFA